MFRHVLLPSRIDPNTATELIENNAAYVLFPTYFALTLVEWLESRLCVGEHLTMARRYNSPIEFSNILSRKGLGSEHRRLVIFRENDR